jgi:cytochrome c
VLRRKLEIFYIVHHLQTFGPELVRTKLLYRIQIVQCLVAITLGSLIFSTTAYAQMDPRQQRGLTFARANCARCHSIDKVTVSPLKLAPPFRELHNRYPVETLEEALGEGIVTGHPNMPEFQLDPDQIGDLISYLKWLER